MSLEGNQEYLLSNCLYIMNETEQKIRGYTIEKSHGQTSRRGQKLREPQNLKVGNVCFGNSLMI